ncbi:MAG: flagellar biosynthetic protein FliO [Deltaproteobacteria bacterium]|jgi:flagellar biogenesis protein FliO|nr:flagellar biosynthetic protein FliO [Deltaproteobacteria bacterium]
MTYGLLFLKTGGALALVLGLFLVIIYALKRWGNLSRRPVSQTMEVLSRQSFGPRHHLIMVKVSGERNVLVGISPQNMSLLCVGDPAPQGGKPSTETGGNI